MRRIVKDCATFRAEYAYLNNWFLNRLEPLRSIELRGILGKRALGNGLYELRERITKVRYRIFYAFNEEKVAVLLHSAVKDQPTVEEDIALARKRLKGLF